MSTPSNAETADKPPRKRLRTRAFETGVGIAGFSGVLRAWRAEGNRLKNVAASLGKKMADMAAGTLVSMSFRLIAVTWVAGIIGGVSTLGMVGLLAAATGAASASYNYIKNFAGEKLRTPKAARKDVKFFDKNRLKKSGVAFAAGFASGGVGLWLARTEIVQNTLGWLRGTLWPSQAISVAPAARTALPAVETATAPAARLTPLFGAALQTATTETPPIQYPALRSHVLPGAAR